MNTVDSGHFLLTAVNSAEDVSLLIEAYNVCTTDDVLRNAVTINQKPLMIFGPVKRHNMCKKKLPQKFKELNLQYKESEINFVTEDTLKDFVSTALEKLKNGVEPKGEVEEIEEVSVTEEVLEELVTEPEDGEEISQPEVSVEIRESTESAGEDVSVDKEGPTRAVESKEHTGAGLCQYGVPKLRVEYLTPSTMGLKESLFVNVSDEDISKFFQSVKNRVLGSIAK